MTTIKKLNLKALILGGLLLLTNAFGLQAERPFPLETVKQFRLHDLDILTAAKFLKNETEILFYEQFYKFKDEAAPILIENPIFTVQELPKDSMQRLALAMEYTTPTGEKVKRTVKIRDIFVQHAELAVALPKLLKMNYTFNYRTPRYTEMFLWDDRKNFVSYKDSAIARRSETDIKAEKKLFDSLNKTLAKASKTISIKEGGTIYAQTVYTQEGRFKELQFAHNHYPEVEAHLHRTFASLKPMPPLLEGKKAIDRPMNLRFKLAPIDIRVENAGIISMNRSLRAELSLLLPMKLDQMLEQDNYTIGFLVNAQGKVINPVLFACSDNNLVNQEVLKAINRFPSLVPKRVNGGTVVSQGTIRKERSNKYPQPRPSLYSRIESKDSLFFKQIDQMMVQKKIEKDGYLILSYIINADGRVSDIETLVGLNKEIDAMYIDQLSKTTSKQPVSETKRTIANRSYTVYWYQKTERKTNSQP